MQKIKKGKISRRKTGLAKYEVVRQEQMEDARTGKTYRSSITLSTATKKATQKLIAASRKPKGNPKYLSQCAYYPIYCNVLGHTTAANKLCGMNKKTPTERKDILSKMKQLQIDKELAELQENGKLFKPMWIIVC